MENILEMIKDLEEKAKNPAKTIAYYTEKTGREAVGCFPIYTPEEIVYAAGKLPVGLWGGKTDLDYSEAYLQGFCCSIMKTNIEFGIRGVYKNLKAVIIPALCDTLKCVVENWKVAVPSIPMVAIVYPQNRWASCSEEYLTLEFKRVRKELEKIFKIFIPDEKIEEAFKVYEDYRATMREFAEVSRNYPATINSVRRHLIIKAGYFMDKAEYKEKVKRIIEELRKMPAEKPINFKVVATGLLGEPVEVLQILDDNGISVVADDFAQESRQFRTAARNEGDVWHKLTWRILDQKGCAFLCESRKTRGEMLIDMAKENNAEGVIVFMMKFCDPEEFDYPIYKKQLEDAGIPLLYLEVDQQMDSFEQIRTRIQSFAEIIGE